MLHIAALITTAALACTASLAHTQPEPKPEPKAPIKTVVRLTTDDGNVKVLIQLDDSIQELIASRVELLDGEGNLTAKLVDQKGTLILHNIPLQLPRVRLGITTEVVPEPLAAQLDLKPVQGLLVTSLIDGLPAAKGGLERYDVLVAIDDKSPVTQQILLQRVQVCQPGESIKLRVVRKGEPIELVVVAEESVETPIAAATYEWTVDATRRYSMYQPIDPRVYSTLGAVVPSVDPDKMPAYIAQYRPHLPVDMTTNLIATPDIEGGLLLDVTPIFSGHNLRFQTRIRPAQSVLALLPEQSPTNDPIENIRAQINAMKHQLASMESLLDQLEQPRD